MSTQKEVSNFTESEPNSEIQFLLLTIKMIVTDIISKIITNFRDISSIVLFCPKWVLNDLQVEKSLNQNILFSFGH